MFGLKVRCIAVLLLFSFALPVFSQDISPFGKINSPSLVLSSNQANSSGEDLIPAYFPKLVYSNKTGVAYWNEIPDRMIDEAPLPPGSTAPAKPAQAKSSSSETAGIFMFVFGLMALPVGVFLGVYDAAEDFGNTSFFWPGFPLALVGLGLTIWGVTLWD